MIGDAAGPKQTWSDEDLEDYLDEHRCEARYRRLHPVESISPGGGVEYKIFEAGIGDWESADLVDSSFAALTPATADLHVGRFTFSAQPSYPVYATGFYYDLAGAAVRVLEAWIARLKCEVDLAADDVSVKRSQIVDHLGELIRRYQREQRVGTGRLLTTDYAAGW